MRFNTDRSNRLSFDRVAGSYDVRPAIPAAVVAWACGQAAVGSSDRVLEVGAGTGQLTMALRARVATLVALEPSPALNTVLRRNTGGEVEVVEAMFEDYTGAGFTSLWSANAFHWIDPGFGYTHARERLTSTGTLVLIWTFLIAQPATRTLLQDLPGAEHVNFVPEDPTAALGGFLASAADGRDELAASRVFDEPQWTLHQEPLTIPASLYADLVLSYANAAALDDHEQRDLHDSITDRLQANQPDLRFDHHAYTLTATAR